jgi:hypothetical protein
MGWVVNSTPRPLYPQERPGTRCIGGWAIPRASLGGCGKLPPVGFDPRPVQAVVGRYTDCAIPANLSSNTISKLQAVRDRDFNRVKLPIVAATIYSVGISAVIVAR